MIRRFPTASALQDHPSTGHHANRPIEARLIPTHPPTCHNTAVVHHSRLNPVELSRSSRPDRDTVKCANPNRDSRQPSLESVSGPRYRLLPPCPHVFARQVPQPHSPTMTATTYSPMPPHMTAFSSPIRVNDTPASSVSSNVALSPASARSFSINSTIPGS